MSYQVLARKWRPHGFDQMVGQGHVLRALINALDSDRLHHAYLFTGTRGVGKTSLARVFAKALNCETGVTSAPCGTCSSCVEVDEGRCVDLIEVDAASRTKVDETRELLDNVQYAPTRGRYKVYLIDEVHMFSTHSFNALLKTLEEPPPHVKFLLATTDPKKLPVTILSRCLQFNLKRISVEQLCAHLRMIVLAENVTADDESLTLLAHAADGSVRDSLSLLDQAIAYGDGQLQQPDVAAMLGTIGAADVASMLQYLAEDDAMALISLARDLAESAPDYHHVLGELLSLVRRVAVFQSLGERSSELDESNDVIELAARLTAQECQLFYQIGLIGRRDLSLAPDPQSGFEMVLLRMLAFRPESVEPQQESARPKTASNRPTAPSPGRAQSRRGDTVRAASRERPRKVATSDAQSPAPSAIADPDPLSAGETLSRSDTGAPSGEARSVSDEPNLASDGEPAAQREIDAGTADTALAESKPGAEDRAESHELDWYELVSSLKLEGLVRELARNSALKAYNGKFIDLVLAPQHENLRVERLINSLELALKQKLGADIRIRLVIEAEQTLDTPSKRISDAQLQRQQEAERNITSDPTVKSLQEEFGATIEMVEPRGDLSGSR